MSCIAVLAIVGAIIAIIPPPPPPPPPASIAVLPFVDLSPNHDQEYLGDGLAEEVLNDLAKVPNLKVVGRASAFQFKGNEDLRMVGQKLNVANVLEGSVQKSGGRVRIAADLVKTHDGFHAWSNSYDQDVGDIFALEDHIAEAVTTALQIQFQKTRIEERPRPIKPEAYQEFLQARYFSHLDDPESAKKALEHASHAIQFDPGYAAAYALHGNVLFRAGAIAWIDYLSAALQSTEEARKAIALAPKLADGYVTMSTIQAQFERNCPDAEKTLSQARTLAPADPDMLANAALFAMCQGHLEQAVALSQQELLLDPLRPDEFMFLAQELTDLGHYDAALAALQKANELNPQGTMIHEVRGEVYLWQGHPQAALAEMKKEPDVLYRKLGSALAYHALGRKRESDQALSEVISKYGTTGAYQIAQVYAYRGDVDEAFQWLSRAYEAHDPGLPWFKTDLKMRSLRNDPRYEQMLTKLNLTESAQT